MAARKYVVLLTLLALIVTSVVYGIAANSKPAALFLNGVMANLFDPFIWLIALPFALKIRKNTILLPSLFIVAAVVCIFKLYMQHKTGSRWITGSIGGVNSTLKCNVIVVEEYLARRQVAESFSGPVV